MLLGIGCHSYVRTDVPGLERGDRVRVFLSEPGAFRLGEVTAERVLQLDGEVVGWDEERLVLSAWWARSVSGREYAGEGLTVHVPREQVRDLEIRRLAALETGLVSAGGLAAALAIGAAMRSGGGSGSGGGGGTPPQTGVGPGSP